MPFGSSGAEPHPNQSSRRRAGADDVAAYRHCMVVHAYYPLGETRVQREAEALTASGYEVHVICLRDVDEPARETYRGVEVHRMPVRLVKRSLARQFASYLLFLVVAGARLAALDIRHRYRSVQIHNLPDFLVFSAIGPKLRGAAVILDLHDLMPEFFAGRFGGRRRLLARLIALQERVACRFADHVVTVSDHWRQTLIDRGVPPGRVSVVMNVADEAIFARRSARPSVAPPFRLVYHGTVTRRYGLDLALRAVDLARAEIPEIHLTILGRGDDTAALRELRRALDLADQVDLRDELLVADALPDVLAEADLGIVPYRDDVFTDGLLPTKLMEYAVIGLPCVAARTTAIEQYFDGTFVELFRPGDAEDLARCLVELHADQERLSELAGRCDLFTTRYNWHEIGERYVQLVGDLAGSSGGAGAAALRSIR